MKRLLLVSVLFFSLICCPNNVFAAVSQQQVNTLQLKVQETKNQETTLSDMVKYFDTVEALDTANASRTAQLISAYSLPTHRKKGVFEGLSINLVLAYPINTLGYFLNELKDIIIPQKNAAQLENKLEESNKTQLALLSQKLAAQKAQIALVRSNKQQLLALTQNDEQKYQQLLDAAQAELTAQEAIVSGKAQEQLTGPVKAGDQIGTIITGASPCSTGTHLHFEVRKKSVAVDPSQYLSPMPFSWAIPNHTQVTFSGTWNWPITTPAVITQEFGMSWFARPGGYSLTGAYNGLPHTGIDMLPANNAKTVYAVTDGTLYKGSMACGGGLLRYMRLQTSPALSIYYEHIL